MLLQDCTLHTQLYRGSTGAAGVFLSGSNDTFTSVCGIIGMCELKVFAMILQ